MFHVEEIDFSRIEELLEILKEKATWLILNNKKMWDITKITKEEILKQYDNPILFLAYEDQEKVGCFILIEYDKVFWNESINDKAYYIHKLVVRNEFGGKGYSNKIIEWIKNYGKINKKKFIRLDYDKKRLYLDNLYKSNGFKEVGDFELRPGLSLIKGEYKII